MAVAVTIMGSTWGGANRCRPTLLIVRGNLGLQDTAAEVMGL
jgi:hypothetical protein